MHQWRLKNLYHSEIDDNMSLQMLKQAQQDEQSLHHCGSLRVISVHNLIRNDTIGRSGFVGLGMTLLKEMCHCGVTLRSLLLQIPLV